MAYVYSQQSGAPSGGDTSAPTTGGAAIGIKNWGVFITAQSSAEKFVMAPPTAGCVKYIVFNSSSSVATAVKFSTNAAQTVSLLSPTGATYTMISRAAGVSTVAATVVQLIGLSATQWLLANVWPTTTTPTAATFGGGITGSTT